MLSKKLPLGCQPLAYTRELELRPGYRGRLGAVFALKTPHDQPHGPEWVVWHTVEDADADTLICEAGNYTRDFDAAREDYERRAARVLDGYARALNAQLTREGWAG